MLPPWDFAKIGTGSSAVPGAVPTPQPARRTVVTIGIVVALAATACSGGKGSSAGGARPGEPVAAPPAGPPAPGKCPLTGQSPPAGVSLDRPVLAVKIDGLLAAEPQEGLDAADVVYDEPVEGGLAWYLAIFHCGNPSRVGPVREARPVDPDILSLYGSGLFATAGGPQAAMDKVRTTPGLVSVDSVTHGPAYARDSGRTAPHNLFADPQKLRSSTGGGSLKPLAAPSPQFDFTAGPAQAGSPKPKGASLTLKMGSQVTYRYDAPSNAYLRAENGQPHLAASGSQLRVVNVVVLWVKIEQTKIVDPAGNSSPQPVVVGQGNAMVLTGGVEHDGKWDRADPTSPVKLLDTTGRSIPLMPGNTWIHLLATDEPAYVQ